MTIPTGEITIRAGRDRGLVYGALGLFLAVCAALAISSLMSAHTVAPRDGMSTMGFDVMAVSVAVVVMTVVTLLTLLCTPTALGTTRIRQDGLLVAKPCRGSRLLPWSEIDSISVDAVSYWRGGATMGLRVVMGGKGMFLPGALDGSPEFRHQVDAVETAWRRANPDAAARLRKGDPTKNRARSKRRRNQRP